MFILSQIVNLEAKDGKVLSETERIRCNLGSGSQSRNSGGSEVVGPQAHCVDWLLSTDPRTGSVL